MRTGAWFAGRLEMRGPRELHEQPQHDRAGKGERDVVEETDRQEAEDERARLAPEPDILVQRVQDSTRQPQRSRS